MACPIGLSNANRDRKGDSAADAEGIEGLAFQAGEIGQINGATDGGGDGGRSSGRCGSAVGSDCDAGDIGVDSGGG